MASNKTKSKAAELKSWLAAHTAGERRMNRVVSAFFAGQRKRIGDAAKGIAKLSRESAPQLLDVAAEHTALMAAVEPILGELLATGAARVFAARPSKVAKKTSKSFDTDLLDKFDLPAAIRDEMEKQFDLITSQPYWREIQSGSLLLVRDTLADAIEQGMSIPNMRRALQDAHAGMSKWRAQAIARTETTGVFGAAQNSSYATLTADGQTLRKQWLSVVDDDTRPDHAEADNQTVDVDGEFTVGSEKCQHPGDVSLSAKQRVNCRCTTSALWGDED
jgi:uncharacterized protein with gpF-like domain